MSSQSITIPLSQGKVALVDAEDYERVSAFKWYASRSKRTWYALHKVCIAPGKWTVISLHRFVMDAPSDKEVDHEDGNGLDCRKCNLRLATRAQNRMNQRAVVAASGYKGVYPAKGTKGWFVTIRHDGQALNLGYYDDPITAAHVYDAKARELFGVFAAPNFSEPSSLPLPNGHVRASNTSGYRGVTFHKQHQKWLAKITHEGRSRHLGLFDNAETAARAYDDAARALKGARARLNFP